MGKLSNRTNQAEARQQKKESQDPSARKKKKEDEDGMIIREKKKGEMGQFHQKETVRRVPEWRSFLSR